MEYNFRRGDTVVLTAVVERDYSDTPGILHKSVSVKIGNNSVTVDRDSLTLRIPFFAPGDRVRKKGGNRFRGEVIAVCDIDVWVAFEGGSRGTVPATDLDLIPEQSHVVAA